MTGAPRMSNFRPLDRDTGFLLPPSVLPGFWVSRDTDWKIANNGNGLRGIGKNAVYLRLFGGQELDEIPKTLLGSGVPSFSKIDFSAGVG